MLRDVKIEITKDILSQRIEEETVLLNTKTGSYFGLNPVASRAWEMLEQGRAPREIAEELAAEFDAAHSQIEEDLETFIESLRGRKLVA